MSAFDRQSAPFLAQEEQQRGDNLVARIAAVVSDPASSTHGSLGLYQAAAQNAYGNAAKYGEQPGGTA